MKRAILVAVAMFIGQSFFAQRSTSTVSTAETYVYICTGPNAKRYHSSSTCRGLDNCSKEIKKVTISIAKDKGRTPCKICYN